MVKVKLKEIRLQKKVKQTQLAEMTGISRNTLYLIENNKTDAIGFETLDKLCKALNCQIGDVLEHEADKY